MFYNNIFGSQIPLLQILHSSFGLVGIFFLMIKWCRESTWSSLCFFPVSFVWIISPSFCCHNPPHRTESQLAVEQAWHHQQLLGQSPENLGYTQKLTERKTSHNFSLRANFSSNCGICLQISSSERFRLKQFTLLLHGIDHNLHSFAKGIKGIIPTPLWVWQPCSHHSQIPQRSGFRASAQVNNSLSIIATPLNSNNHTWMHSLKSRCTAPVVLDLTNFSVDMERTLCFPFPTL